MKAVVVRAGSRRSVRAARARPAAATSSVDACPSSGTNTWTPLAPLVLTAPSRPASASARRTAWAARTASVNPLSAGGSRSSTRWVGGPTSMRNSAGWYSTARWLANHSSVRRSLHRAYDTWRCDASAHIDTVATHDGVYFGTFFCMNGVWPRWTRITDRGRSPQHRNDPVGDGVEVVDEVPFGGPGAVEERLVEVGQRDAVPLLVTWGQDGLDFSGVYRSGSGGWKRRSQAWARNRAVVTGFVTQSPS